MPNKSLILEDTQYLVITNVPIPMRNLFVAIAEDYLKIERVDIFKSMFKPFAEKVIEDLARNEDCDILALEALKSEIDDMFMPKLVNGLST